MWTRIQAYIAQSPFLQNVLTLLTGTLLAQLITIALYPVLTHLYSSADFGIFGIFSAIVITLAVGLNLGYEAAIMLPKEQKTASQLFTISLCIAIMISILAGIVAVIGGPWLLDYYEIPELKGWHLLIPLSLIMEGALQPLRVMHNRLSQYRTLSTAKVSQGLTTGILSVLLGLTPLGFAGLIIGYLTGQAAALLVLLPKYLQTHAAEWSHSWEQLQETASSYKDFPGFLIWGNWLNTASSQLPFFLLLSYFGDKAIVGYFALAARLLMMPVTLISRSVADVFYQNATAAKEVGIEALGKLTRSTFKNLALLGILPMLLLMWIGPWLFALVFGEEWREAGLYARWLMPWVYMVFVTSPLSYLLDVQRKLRYHLFYSIFLFIVRLLALVVGGLYYDARTTVMLYSLAGFITVSANLGYLLRLGGAYGLKDKG